MRLRTEASLGLLIVDLLVLWFALGGARDDGAPTWIRVVFLAVAVSAVVLGVHSVLLLVRRSRGKN